MGLLGELWRPGEHVRLVGVGVSGFGETDGEQLSLFDGPAEGEGCGQRPRDRSALGRVTDELRERFGDEAVSYGRDLRFRGRTSDTMPMHKDAY